MKSVYRFGIFAAVTFLAVMGCDTPTNELPIEYSNQVVCWGDSLTAGGYPEVLSGLINTYPGEFEVLNRGVPGERTPDISARLFASEETRMGAWTIVFMGENGGWADGADLVAQFKAMVDYSRSSNYIVITSHGNSTNEAEAAMTKAFGRHYINLRKLTRSERFMTDAGLTVSGQDQEDVSNGKCPSSLLRDHVHFNTAGNLALATAIANKIEDLEAK